MDADFATSYAELEDGHWWFTARRLILRRLLGRSMRWSDETSVLEVGVGSGANLYELYPTCDLVGLEPEEGNADVARARGSVPVVTGSLEDCATCFGTRTFDVVTMFDVLEHIEDDMAALRSIHDRLSAGGRLVLTVPAYMWMWGRQDEVSHHYRRYTRTELAAKLRRTGFHVRRATYFNTFLFPVIASVRLLARVVPFGGNSDFDFKPGVVNGLLHRIFAAEAWWLESGAAFPVGVSIFVAAEKG